MILDEKRKTIREQEQLSTEIISSSPSLTAGPHEAKATDCKKLSGVLQHRENKSTTIHLC